jgi:serine/threonine protein kinase
LTLGYGGTASDVYSVGVSAYRLLVGGWPFNGATEADLGRAIVDRDYVRLRDAAPHVSRRLAERIEKAMAADPADRHISAMAMHDELGKPGLVQRVWQRQSAHSGHLACWLETRSGASHQVCAVDRGDGRADIETRFEGSGRRIVDHCHSGITPRDLSVRLRQVFDHL